MAVTQSGPAVTLIVLRAADPAALVRVYELFGCQFQQERHGKGPEHFSADLAGTILEIYPRTSGDATTAALRIGFAVADLDGVLLLTGKAGVRTLTPAKATQWGRRAVVIDQEGHRIELTERAAP